VTRNAFDKWFNIIFGGINYDKQLKQMQEREAAANLQTEYADKKE
jgi:hypothetical protein